MATLAATRAAPPRALMRFFRSPKGLLLIVLGLLTALAVPAEGPSQVLPRLGVAMLVAALVDLALARTQRGVWILPDGALLTGLIVALVQSQTTPLSITAFTAALAIVSKYLFRTRFSNVLNPAALALVVSTLLFGTGQSWWGAFPDVSPVALLALLAGGLFLASRLNKLPMVLVFLGVYYALFTVAAFFGDPARVAEIFRVPDVNAALFFAFFMLDDPPTSPVRYGDQAAYALVVAAVSFGVFESLGVVYYLLAGVLAGNLWESWRRLDAAGASAAKGQPARIQRGLK